MTNQPITLGKINERMPQIMALLQRKVWSQYTADCYDRDEFVSAGVMWLYDHPEHKIWLEDDNAVANRALLAIRAERYHTAKMALKERKVAPVRLAFENGEPVNAAEFTDESDLLFDIEAVLDGLSDEAATVASAVINGEGGEKLLKANGRFHKGGVANLLGCHRNDAKVKTTLGTLRAVFQPFRNGKLAAA